MPFIGRGLLAILGLLVLSCRAQNGGASGVWHYINVQDIVCPGGPGYATVSILQPAMLSPDPAIFTIFRTTMNPVVVSFVAKDATGRTVVDQSAHLTLQAVTPRYGRRLEDDEDEAEDAEEEAEEEPEEAPIRGLLSRRRMSSPRRRTYTDSRRRAITDSRRRTVMVSPRRRAPMVSPRRRYMMDTGRRRSTSYSSGRRRGGGSSFVPSYHYSNPLSPSMGRYGYASPSYASHLYGGHMPMSTSYGYTGANAYSSGSGMKIALAGGAGLLAGYAAGHLFNSPGSNFGGYTQQQMMNAPCTAGSWSGTCNTCLSQYGANRCDVTLSPNFDATRDDLMSTGFMPTQVSWPLTVRFMSVNGVDFNPDVICPASPGMAWSPPNMQRLFLTTTSMGARPPGPGPGGPGYDEYGNGYGYSTYQSSASGTGFFAWFSTVVGLCCCCGLCACCYATSKRGKKPPNWGPFGGGGASGDESESVEFVHQDAYNPYWHNQGAQTTVAFMDTPAPGGVSWASYCHGTPEVSPKSGFVGGKWGDCLAWAVIYEHQNPDWEHNPSYQEMGPAGSVIAAMLEKSSDSDAEDVEKAADRLESACRQAIAAGGPLPVINRRA